MCSWVRASCRSDFPHGVLELLAFTWDTSFKFFKIGQSLSYQPGPFGSGQLVSGNDVEAAMFPWWVLWRWGQGAFSLQKLRQHHAQGQLAGQWVWGRGHPTRLPQWHTPWLFLWVECESLWLDAEPGVLAGSVLTASPVFGVLHGDQH